MHFAEYVVVGELLVGEALLVGGGVELTGVDEWVELTGVDEWVELMAEEDFGGGVTTPPAHRTVAFCSATAVCA